MLFKNAFFGSMPIIMAAILLFPPNAKAAPCGDKSELKASGTIEAHFVTAGPATYSWVATDRKVTIKEGSVKSTIDGIESEINLSGKVKEQKDVGNYHVVVATFNENPSKRKPVGFEDNFYLNVGEKASSYYRPKVLYQGMIGRGTLKKFEVNVTEDADNVTPAILRFLNEELALVDAAVPINIAKRRDDPTFGISRSKFTFINNTEMTFESNFDFKVKREKVRCK